MNKILLRSSWQVVNIGDIAHTPGLLALLEKHYPEAEVILWASEDLTEEVAVMEHRRFPGLHIVKGKIGEGGKATNRELAEAIAWCDFLLHGSGPLLMGKEDLKAFSAYTGKPFGVFGITFGSFDEGPEDVEILNKAEFAYFRDSLSLQKAEEMGVRCPVVKFGPDAAFSTDLRDDAKALRYLSANGLEEGKFLCCIAKLRYTPYWKITDRPFDVGRQARNEAMKEHDHKRLREAIVRVVRETDLKVLICPEDITEIAVGKEMLYDRLPNDVCARVVWRESFWLTDEALSVYVRSAGMFGNEMHSPIMCVGNGVPAIVCRWEEQTSKGRMWKDIGLADWLFDVDSDADMERLVPAVLELAKEPAAAKRKAAKALELVRRLQAEMVDTLKRSMTPQKNAV